MARSVPYKSIGKEELEKILSASEIVPSFAGQEYINMHKSVIQEIQSQKDLNEKAAQRGMHMTINSSFDNPLHLQPDVENFVNNLVQIVREDATWQNSLTSDQIHDLHELATFCITTESPAEQKAERILVRGEHARSQKLYNVRFNIKNVISLLFDWILLGDITESTSLQLLVMLILSIGKLYDLTIKEFNELHAVILQEVYRAPKIDGMVEEDFVIQRIQSQYEAEHPDWDVPTISAAVTELDKFCCLDICNGKLALTENLVIQ